MWKLVRPALAGAMRVARHGGWVSQQVQADQGGGCWLRASFAASIHTSHPAFQLAAQEEKGAEQCSPPSEKVQRLVEEIAGLTLLEVADLTDSLRKKLNLPDVPVGVAMGVPAAGVAGNAAPAEAKEEPKEEKTSFDVKLDKYDAPSKIKVIKEVRAITGLGLKEAKELVEKAPAVIKKGVTKEEADELVAKLKAVGGTLVLE